MPDVKLMVRRMIADWQNENIPIRSGVDELALQRFEHKNGVKVPADMREYFSTVNGMGDHYDEANFFRFWPIEQVKPVREYLPIFAEKFPQFANYFLFFDHSIDLS